MGTEHSLSSVTQQTCLALSAYAPEEIRILEWRSNSQFSEFIPRVTFQYQQTKKTGTFIDRCQHNQNLKLNVRHENFIGNLTILTGKLCFEEALYVLKSLLSGHQIIHGFFGKSLVSPLCCFITKDGEVKAWINQDYRRNTFSFETQNEDICNLDEQKLFLKPQKWIDHEKASSSQGNIIQKILFEVAQLTYHKKEFDSLLHNFDAFIHGNILKNFNFDRVKKFVNKYIYKKQIFVKSSLIEVVEKLYYQSIEKKTVLSRSAVSRQSQVERRLSQMSMIKEEIQPLSLQVSPLPTKTNFSPVKRSFVRQSMKTKNSEFFCSTAYTNSNTNQSSKFMSSNAQFQQTDGPLYASCCSSQIEGHRLYDSVKSSQNWNKNHISHQFSMNYCTETSKTPTSSYKRQSSMIPNLKSSVLSSISSKNSIKFNKTVEFKMKQSNLKVIHERKETDPSDRRQASHRGKEQCLKTSIMDHRQLYMSIENSFSKNQKIPTFKANNGLESKKTSNISIAQKENFAPTLKGRPFESAVDKNDKQNRRSFNAVDSSKLSSENQQFDQKNKEPIHNFFTMKTITKLISSNQNISQQQQSEGDFPSNQNISSYSGILASMGRSAVIMDVPDSNKPQFKTRNKKQESTFVSNQFFPSKDAGIKSYDFLFK